MKKSLDFNKRKLLEEVFGGNLTNVIVYRQQVKQHEHAIDLSQYDIRWLIDNRGVGGGIELVERSGNKRAITVEEFDALPVDLTRHCWQSRDYTGGQPVRAPDEDYDYQNDRAIEQIRP